VEEVMSAALTVDRKKYVRIANRIVVKAIESQEEYDRMVTAEQLMNKGEDRLSPEETALLQLNSMLSRKLPLAQKVVRIRVLPVMPGT
jgi:hypothetical protein